MNIFNSKREFDACAEELGKRLQLECDVIEWNNIHGMLFARLREKWKVTGKGISMKVAELGSPNDFFGFRGFGVAIQQTSAIGKELLTTVREFATDQNVDLTICVCNGWCFLKTLDGNDFPDFEILITRRFEIAWFEDIATAALFGIESKGSTA